LRPFAEISNAVSSACEIKTENPALKYKVNGEIGRGGFGVIFEVIRKSDGKLFALKFTSPSSEAERQSVINECSLIKFLECD